jgi:hypothetical protein
MGDRVSTDFDMPANATTPAAIDPAHAAESNTTRYITLVTIFHALAITVFTARIYARTFIIRAFGSDDIVMIFCAVW